MRSSVPTSMPANDRLSMRRECSSRFCRKRWTSEKASRRTIQRDRPSEFRHLPRGPH